MPLPETRVTVAHFTNPHYQRVHQVMVGGMPITREFSDAEADRALAVARQEFERVRRPAVLLDWDGDTRVETELERL